MILYLFYDNRWHSPQFRLKKPDNAFFVEGGDILSPDEYPFF